MIFSLLCPVGEGKLNCVTLPTLLTFLITALNADSGIFRRFSGSFFKQGLRGLGFGILLYLCRFIIKCFKTQTSQILIKTSCSHIYHFRGYIWGQKSWHKQFSKPKLNILILLFTEYPHSNLKLDFPQSYKEKLCCSSERWFFKNTFTHPWSGLPLKVKDCRFKISVSFSFKLIPLNHSNAKR